MNWVLPKILVCDSAILVSAWSGASHLDTWSWSWSSYSKSGVVMVPRASPSSKGCRSSLSEIGLHFGSYLSQMLMDFAQIWVI